jgi:hypothetical protein
MWWRLAVVALVVAVMLGPQPGLSQQQLMPLVAEWETMFRVESGLAEERGGRVTGYVVNQSGLATKRIRLLVDALEGGRVVGQRLSWLGTDLGPGRRAYGGGSRSGLGLPSERLRLRDLARSGQRRTAERGPGVELAMKRWIAAAAVTLVLWPLPGGSQPLVPLVVGRETEFSTEWSVGEERGQRVVWGYVTNRGGKAAARMRLLVDAIEDGRVVGQRVSWLGETLTPGSRAYFRIPVPAQAPAYRVTVFDYEIRRSGV